MTKFSKVFLFKDQKFLFKGFGQNGADLRFPEVFLFKDQIGPKSFYLGVKCKKFLFKDQIWLQKFLFKGQIAKVFIIKDQKFLFKGQEVMPESSKVFIFKDQMAPAGVFILEFLLYSYATCADPCVGPCDPIRYI